MRRAHLRYADGTIRIVDVPGVPGQPWPHDIKRIDALVHPIVGRVLDVATIFVVDRVSFDPDRDWQEYRESEA